jgi:hypothetical protein
MDSEHENEELLTLDDIDDTNDALQWLGDKLEELFAVVTDDDALPDDAKADIIQMMEEIQQYIDDAEQIIADLPEEG